MRKFILSAILLLATVSAAGSLANAQDNNTQPRRRSAIVADSVRSKGTRIGQRVAEGTAVVVDSVGAKGARLGKKSMVLGDSLVQRSRRAVKALKGEDVKPVEQNKSK